LLNSTSSCFRDFGI